MRHISRTIILGLLMLIASSASLYATTYQMRYLSTPEGLFSEPRAINDSGQVVGYIQNNKQLAVWQDGVRTAPITQESVGLDINSNGSVLGWYRPGDGYEHCFTWSPSIGTTDLFGQIPDSAYPVAFNDSAQIIGNDLGLASQGAGDSIGFIWQSGMDLTYINAADGSPSLVSDINNSGQVVGKISLSDHSEHAFVWDRQAGMTDITPNARFAGATAINGLGQVTGWYYPEPDRLGAFIWSAVSGLAVIQPRDDVLGFGPVAVNDHGVVLGAALVADGRQVTATWTADGGFDIVGEFAPTAINNAGQIVGFVGQAGSLNERAVLWEPVPEPSSLLVLGMGIAPIAGMLMRGRRRT